MAARRQDQPFNIRAPVLIGCYFLFLMDRPGLGGEHQRLGDHLDVQRNDDLVRNFTGPTIAVLG
jgi:hypothetical protein